MANDKTMGASSEETASATASAPASASAPAPDRGSHSNEDAKRESVRTGGEPSGRAKHAAEGAEGADGSSGASPSDAEAPASGGKAPACTKEAFDHKGTLYPSRKKMCKAYGVTPDAYTAKICAGKSKQEALTGRKPWQERVGKAAVVLLAILAVLLFIAVHHAVRFPLDISTADGSGSTIDVQEGTADDDLSLEGQLGEKVHVEYSTMATVNADGSVSCMVRNATEGKDVRFSVELALDTANGGQTTIASSDVRIAPGEQIDALTAVRGAALPAREVYGSFVLTLYEGDDDEPLLQKVIVDSIVVAPA